jgi:hypothetical protein
MPAPNLLRYSYDSARQKNSLKRSAKRAPKILADALEVRRGNVKNIETANSKNKI